MLPIPLQDYIPKILRQKINDDGQAFLDKIDDLLEEISEEILEIYFFKRPERISAILVDELGYYLNAGLKNTDSDDIKRKKIANAIKSHKNRGTWNDDVKIRIDTITGYSAALYTNVNNDDSIEMGYTQDEINQGSNLYYWSTESGYDGSDDYLGTWEVGDSYEYVWAGNVAIDCHEGVYTAVLTAAEIEQIVVELQDDVVPAYQRILLGYINTSGQFIIYEIIE